MKKIALYLIIFILGMLPGYYFGNFYTKHNVPVTFTCQDITNFHADLLLKNYIKEFNTDSTNPEREINQRASDLNAAILNICDTDPREKPCTSDLKEATTKLCSTTSSRVPK